MRTRRVHSTNQEPQAQTHTHTHLFCIQALCPEVVADLLCLRWQARDEVALQQILHCQGEVISALAFTILGESCERSIHCECMCRHDGPSSDAATTHSTGCMTQGEGRREGKLQGCAKHACMHTEHTTWPHNTSLYARMRHLRSLPRRTMASKNSNLIMACSSFTATSGLFLSGWKLHTIKIVSQSLRLMDKLSGSGIAASSRKEVKELRGMWYGSLPPVA